MMPDKKNAILIASLGLVSILGLGGFAHQEGGGKRDALMGKGLDRVLEKIDATPEQAEQIRAIRDRLVAERPQMDRKNELLEIWGQGKPDPAQIHAAIDARADERRAFAHKMADAMIEAHGILTPAQRDQVRELIAKKAEHRKHHGKREGRKARKAPAAD